MCHEPALRMAAQADEGSQIEQLQREVAAEKASLTAAPVKTGEVK